MSLIVDIKKRLSNFDLDLQFETSDGGVFAILGASGSGKSMALKCIAGIEKPDSGYIELDGKVFMILKIILILSLKKEMLDFYFKIMHCFQT
ncbi:putative transport protein [Brachyspira pilosicoli B2904]|uniref:Putative transport protein n=1 Tax=Brachyspira pilosicoli B2904 TaxID=1133568 RepID=J9UU53_BRAPL|nr:ATP-binding cassette domain-containing protein [Brachyspira pilosicoli]AFR70789.1 putative transport protein [Brachyspira pilosicoli B2904]